MCGVAGIYAYRPSAPRVDREELRRIRDHMAARGPDGKGEWFSESGRLALGHRRLSIIDLSDRGAQPMGTEDGGVVVSFNGEIYNYRALRGALERKGYCFRSHSDTEVLLHLYADKGEGMFDELRGMYAFALWDARKRALLLARDPYGIKPLYYADDGGTLRAASQVKALLMGGGISRSLCPAGLTGFYLFGSVPEPHTIYRSIRALPAGTYLWVTGCGPRTPESFCSVSSVWRDAVRRPQPLAEGDLGERVRAAVLDSVRHHMVADVPVGLFLSAGVDSGALLGLMSEAQRGASNAGRPPQPARINTVTLAFEEFRGKRGDEAPLAARVARRYAAEHVVRTVTRTEFQADLPRILDAMDQPSIDGVNTWFVSKAAAELGLKVAISGLGGDELFGGYPTFRDIPRWVRTFALPSRVPGLGDAFRHAVSVLAPQTPGFSPKTAGLLKYGGTYPGAYLLRRGLFMPWELSGFMDPELVAAGLAELQPLGHLQAALAPDPVSSFARVAALEASLYMRNQLLRDTDWASLAHSLEVRTPLVDIQLLRDVAPVLAASARPHGKRWLSESPRPPLPAVVADRAKTGFTVPIDDWLAGDPRVGSWRSLGPLTRKGTPWARRWAYVLGTRITESASLRAAA
jgi:asparagine synthase (glutamine-hydrolysing)